MKSSSSTGGSKAKARKSKDLAPAVSAHPFNEKPERTRTKAPTKERQPVRRASMTVDEVAVYLGISRTAVYNAVRKGEIPAARIGERWIVPIHSLKAKFPGLFDDEGPWK